MENYKKLSLLALLSISSAAIAYYDTTGTPSPDDFDDLSGGALHQPTTVLEQEARKVKQTVGSASRSTAPSTQRAETKKAQTPIADFQATKRYERKIFNAAINAVNTALEAVKNESGALNEQARAVATVLASYENEQAAVDSARGWTKWEAGTAAGAAIGLSGILILQKGSTQALWSTALFTIGGGTTWLLRRQHTRECNTRQEALDRDTINTIDTQLAKLTTPEDDTLEKLIREADDYLTVMANLKVRDELLFDETLIKLREARDIIASAKGSKAAAISKYTSLEQLRNSINKRI